MSRSDKRNAEFVTKRGAVAPITNPALRSKLGTAFHTAETFREHVLGRRSVQTDEPRRAVAIQRLRARRKA